MRIPIKEDTIIAKKLPISNPYSIPRTFRISSSRPEIVEVGEEVLNINGLGSTTTTLYFNNVVRSPVRFEVCASMCIYRSLLLIHSSGMQNYCRD
ncbi:hypothetical protein ANCCEY_15807 [Ancylostoma ceylanicum]|uniref:NPHP4 Ig-like domain-containing protein n=1 Tax=Ancylostoma ceylanicum TaxID=53326 RepID=A0A0D6L3A3_9BILA|nr:hypothetical protein ANCCEY_15807 [Ancylostoma ceylanicum]